MSKLKSDMLAGALFRKSTRYKKNIGFAEDGVKKMLDLCENVSLSISFGKQSICLAHMVYTIHPSVPMYFLASSETWWLDTYLDSLRLMRVICPDMNLTIVQTNRLSVELDKEMSDAQETGAKLIKRGWNEFTPKTWDESRKSGDKDIQTMLDQELYDGWFWGLSVDESFTRQRTLLKQSKTSIHPSIFKYASGKYRCCPLMFWKEDTLAGYISTYNLPLLSAYKEGGLTERTTARITGTADRMQAFERMRRNRPDGYAKIVNAYPELGLKT